MIISIDIETTGLNPETCQILEIGMVNDRNEEFHCHVNNGLIQGEPFALAMNQEILKKIAEGEDTFCVNHVVYFMKTWLPEEFTVIGKNFASFDLQFLKKLPGWDIKIRHRILDIGNLYWDGEEDKLPNLKTCMERAEIHRDVPHNALDDARITMQLLEKWKINDNSN